MLCEKVPDFCTKIGHFFLLFALDIPEQTVRNLANVRKWPGFLCLTEFMHNLIISIRAVEVYTVAKEQRGGGAVPKRVGVTHL